MFLRSQEVTTLTPDTNSFSADGNVPKKLGSYNSTTVIVVAATIMVMFLRSQEVTTSQQLQQNLHVYMVMFLRSQEVTTSSANLIASCCYGNVPKKLGSYNFL